ncbi:hypothetical protein [Halomonas dongshanensis]|uniref:Uncharacterized protein n=1 Tax=Halomonas dongshanensis TaxID=2890835 RepID=A0ABT2EIC3_9GAMM|nr:hypothetical protein [Halomonas dongshanensis]MCS2610354.1 hypothetical protein [Halomonas dongshanensis]
MDDLAASDLKTILHSKRANLYYLQHCRVLVNGGRVEYVTDEGKRSKYWNIPIANTTSLKDAVILPQAFISASRGDEEQEFRQSCIERLSQVEALDTMIDTLKTVAERLSAEANR